MPVLGTFHKNDFMILITSKIYDKRIFMTLFKSRRNAPAGKKRTGTI